MPQQQTKRSLEEYQMLTEPLFAHKLREKLIEKAKKASSGTAAFKLAAKVTPDEDAVKACRFLFIIGKTFGPDALEATIAKHTN